MATPARLPESSGIQGVSSSRRQVAAAGLRRGHHAPAAGLASSADIIFPLCPCWQVRVLLALIRDESGERHPRAVRHPWCNRWCATEPVLKLGRWRQLRLQQGGARDGSARDVGASYALQRKIMMGCNGLQLRASAGAPSIRPPSPQAAFCSSPARSMAILSCPPQKPVLLCAARRQAQSKRSSRRLGRRSSARGRW